MLHDSSGTGLSAGIADGASLSLFTEPHNAYYYNTLMSKPRSAFTTTLSADRATAILVDLNGEVSVTNDAEAVVQSVYNAHPEIERIIYRDSARQWDELVFEVVEDRAEFRKFASVPAQLAEELNLISR